MTTTTVPGYRVGTWVIDPVHSELGFTVRHMMVSKVRGKFERFEGRIVTAENPLESSATATADMSSITTGNDQRDAHLRSEDFFAADTHPQLSYRSTAIRPHGDHFLVDGELTIRGITRPITLTVEVNGFGPDPYGGTRAGFSARGELNRRDFGVSWNAAIEGGGVVVSDTVQLTIEVEAVLQT
jgi:polyisoprenoid-binding protein YceI